MLPEFYCISGYGAFYKNAKACLWWVNSNIAVPVCLLASMAAAHCVCLEISFINSNTGCQKGSGKCAVGWDYTGQKTNRSPVMECKF